MRHGRTDEDHVGQRLDAEGTKVEIIDECGLTREQLRVFDAAYGGSEDRPGHAGAYLEIGEYRPRISVDRIPEFFEHLGAALRIFQHPPMSETVEHGRLGSERDGHALGR